MADCHPLPIHPSADRRHVCWGRRVVVFASLLALSLGTGGCLMATAPRAAKGQTAHPVAQAAPPIAALQRSPALNDYFPFGFWYADAPHSEQLAAGLGETHEVRQEKILHDLSRHYVNALFPANRALTPAYLDMAGRFGIRAATMPLLLYRHIDHARRPGEQDLEWVKTAWSAHATQLRDHPALLAYHVFDEPHPTLSPKIQEITAALAKLDPLHPALYTHQNLPLDRDNPAWGRPEWDLLSSLDVVLSDLYSIDPAWGRDPWAYGDVGLAEFRKVNPDSLQWPIIQAFSYNAMPTLGEVRVMVFHTIACGAKGMFVFTTGQAYAPWINPLYPSVGNPWFAPEPLWEDLGRIGRHLTSAGPLLIPRRLDPEYPVRVDTAAFLATVRTGWLRADGDLTRPAIHVGAFVGDGGDVLVVHNDDPWQERSGRVTVTGRGAAVYDLDTLRQVPSRKAGRQVSFAVTLAPGDGRLYLVAGAADFAAARSRVQRHLYDRESLLSSLEAAMVAKAGVGVDRAAAHLTAAAACARAADYSVAREQVADAGDALAKAKREHAPYARTTFALDGMRADLQRCEEWCYLHPDFLTGGLGDERLAQAVTELTECSRQFAALENDQRAGQPRAEEAEAVQTRIAAVTDRLQSWRPQALEQRRIGLLELGDATEDARSLQDWLAMVCRQVEEVRPGDGLAQRLAGYDLIWLHLGAPGRPVTATYCGEARVAAGALSPATIAALRAYVAAGGGLILSGLAATLVDDLGYDTVAPNECYWGPLIVPGGGKMAWTSFGQSGHVLGLKPVLTEHPIFRGLPADGFGIWDWGLSEMVAKAVWRRPAWPAAGTVLAGYYADGAEIPDAYAVVVEYGGNPGGKVVAIGDGLDPARDAAYTTGKRWGTHQDRLIRNLVAYVAAGK